MSEELQMVLAGAPVDNKELMASIGQPEYVPYQGSIQKECESCHHMMWVGPRLQQSKAIHPDWPLKCWSCLRRDVESGEFEVGDIRDLGNPGP